jgi:hypothetical protein
VSTPFERQPHDAPPDEPVEPASPATRSRRSLLKLFGALAVGAAGGAVVRSETADATNGDSLVVGMQNAATSTTRLVTTGAISGDGAFVVSAEAADWALEGSSGQIGVLGSGFIGVSGSGDVGGFFSGNLAAISLHPQDTPGAPTSGDFSKGDIRVDAAGVMYLCVAAGSPGTWIKLSHGGYRPLPAPVRAYDSRGNAGGKLQPGAGDIASPRPIPITAAVSAVPTNAVAIAGNLAVTESEGGGFATVWPEGDWPGTANINYAAGVDLSNSFTVGLGAGGTIKISASTRTHVVIDVAGYIL